MAAIDLIVLGMIKSQPQSAYELQKNVEYRHISRWVKVSTPSIYKKVVQLEEKGYISGESVREGKMPEKTIYQITEQGEKYFLELMEQTSKEAVRVFLNFNAVIMNLGLVPEEERRELMEHMEKEILDFQAYVTQKQAERQQAPLTGRTILDQQRRVADALAGWMADFRKDYL